MDTKRILKETLTIKFDKAFGLDIGDRSMEIIELEKVFRFSVVTYGRTDLPAGVVENGKILNQDILAERLKNLLKEAKPKRVSTNKVIVSLPESQVFVLSFEVDAKLKAAALSRAIVDKVSLILPINIDKTYWDFVVKPLADKKKKLIMFFGVPKDVANSYVKFCNSIGLEVVSLCLESLSLARAILKSSPKQSLIIEIGAGATNLSFYDSNDRIDMAVTVPVAGEAMTEAVKTALKLEGAEAESLKIKFGLKDLKDNKVRPLILPVLVDIVREITGAINYYEETFKHKMEDVYLIGGSALLPGITEYLTAELKRPVKIATGNSSINLSVVMSKNNSFPLFANVIGLGMLGASGEFSDLNLLKKLPSAQVNSVNRLNLFNMGYLSRINTVRTIINNKFMLVVMVLLIGVIFAVLLQQTQNFGVSANPVAAPLKPRIVPRLGTSTLPRIGTSTIPGFGLPIITKPKVSTSTKPVSTTTLKLNGK